MNLKNSIFQIHVVKVISFYSLYQAVITYYLLYKLFLIHYYPSPDKGPYSLRDQIKRLENLLPYKCRGVLSCIKL